MALAFGRVVSSTNNCVVVVGVSQSDSLLTRVNFRVINVRYFSDRSDDRRSLNSAQRLPPTVVRCPLADWGSQRLPGDTMVLSICT